MSATHSFEDVTHVDNNADGEHFEKVTYYSTQSLKMIIIFEYMGEHNHRKYCNNLKIFRADNVCSGEKIVSVCSLALIFNIFLKTKQKCENLQLTKLI